MPWNTAGNIKGPKGDPGNAADIAALIHAAASKTPADADELSILDNASSWTLKKFTWGALKSTLQSLFFYRGNIVGLVSQTGGIPTGSIIQSGSNANGNFVRYADGTQECWVDLNFSAAINVADGVLYLSPPVGNWTFPASFSGSLSVVSQVTSTGAFGMYPVSDNISNTAVDGFYLVSSSSRTSAPRKITRVAKGRWF